MPPGGEDELEILDQQPVVVALAQALHLHHLVAQPLGERDADLGAALPALLVLADQGVEGLDARLALGLLGARGGADPLQLLAQRPLARRLRLLLTRQARLLLVQPARVVALEGETAAVVELQDPGRDVVEEVAVVGHQHDGAVVLLQVVLEPGHRLGVEVIGRLVEQQQVRSLEQQPAEGHAALLASGERRHHRV
ncbi:conserved hypothetical protein, partial [sediment metagenome]